jgi:hypothetical protein
MTLALLTGVLEAKHDPAVQPGQRSPGVARLEKPVPA